MAEAPADAAAPQSRLQGSAARLATAVFARLRGDMSAAAEHEEAAAARLWYQEIVRRREEAVQQAEAPAGPNDNGAAPQQERNADAAGPPPRGKNLVKVADALKKRALEERDEADANAEKKQKTLASIAKQWICPITLMLPTEPVKAEDGHTYEREAIEGWLAQNATSPVTRAHMGTRLMEDYAAKNTIEELVTSGAIVRRTSR